MDPAPDRLGTSAAASHRLPRPDVLTSLQALARLVGPVEALRAWQEAAQETGHHGTALSQHQLLEVAQVLSSRPGPLRVFGCSLAARLRMQLVLDRTSAGARS